MKADEIIAQLGLTPHPEGGHFGQWTTDQGPVGAQDYWVWVLKTGDVVVRQDRSQPEAWFFIEGSSVILEMGEGRTSLPRRCTLSDDVSVGTPEVYVPANDHLRVQTYGAFAVCHRVFGLRPVEPNYPTSWV